MYSNLEIVADCDEEIGLPLKDKVPPPPMPFNSMAQSRSLQHAYDLEPDTFCVVSWLSQETVTVVVNVPLPHNVVQLQVESAEELRESDVHLCPRKTAGPKFRTCSPIGHSKGQRLTSFQCSFCVPDERGQNTWRSGRGVDLIQAIFRGRKCMGRGRHWDPTSDPKESYQPGSCYN